MSSADIPFLSRCWFGLHNFIYVMKYSLDFNNEHICFVLHYRCSICGSDKVRIAR